MKHMRWIDQNIEMKILYCLPRQAENAVRQVKKKNVDSGTFIFMSEYPILKLQITSNQFTLMAQLFKQTFR